MRKALVLILSITMILGATTLSFGAGYRDIDSSNWAYEAVNAMSDKTIVKGYPDGTFKPTNTVTYGEFIKMALISATGKDVGNSDSENWALNYYNTALDLGYFTGYDIAKEKLDSKITRAHMALIISSILGDIKIENYDEIQKGITDITAQTEYEYDITKSYGAGILTGYTDDTFRPEKTLSRAEAATVIYRLVDESKRVLPGEKIEEEISGYKLVTTTDYIDLSPLANKAKEDVGDFTEKAELYEDASSFNVTINKTYTTEWGSSFNHELCGFIYLVKDGKIVDNCITTPRYDSDGNFLHSYGSMAKIDVTTADYIVCVSSNVNTNFMAKIVRNPFK